jgi:rhodanese-related sulfurtransferase
MRFRNFPFFIQYFLLPSLFFGLGIVSLAAQQTLNPKFEKKVASLIDNTIPTINCPTLYKKIATENLYLLDAREAVEYKVSHLKGALYIGYDHFSAMKVLRIPKAATLVVYCSVGYRSEKIGEKLKALGYSKVYNLYGGIFEWSNAGYPLVDEQETPTQKVHAFNKDWGRWLEKGTKVY